MKKKCYYISGEDYDGGFAIVATSLKEAKKIGWERYALDLGLDEYIYMRVKWKKRVKVDDLEIGYELEPNDGLKRGAYDYAEGKCPLCEVEGMIYNSGGKVMCMECEDKEE